VAILPLAAVAACTGGSAPTSLPSDSGTAPTATPPSTTTATGTPGEQVLAAYLRYWDALLVAHERADPRSAGLATVAVDPELSRIRDTIDRNRIQQISLRGEVSHDPAVRQVAGGSATVEDCYDISGWNPVNLKTGAAIDVTEEGGTGRYRARYTLRRSGTSWLVATDAPLGGC
jgi:hypothetical protein